MATYQVLGLNQGLGYGDTLNVVTSTFDNVANPVATTDIIFAYNETLAAGNPNFALQLLQLQTALRTFEYFLLQGKVAGFSQINEI